MKTIVASTALLISLFAGYSLAQSPQTVSGHISRLYPSPVSGMINFRLKEDPCGKETNNKYYQIPDTDLDYQKKAYALLLHAASTGQKVYVKVPGCTGTSNTMVEYVYIDPSDA
jgi:hypothetical protein